MKGGGRNVAIPPALQSLMLFSPPPPLALPTAVDADFPPAFVFFHFKDI